VQFVIVIDVLKSGKRGSGQQHTQNHPRSVGGRPAPFTALARRANMLKAAKAALFEYECRLYQP